MLPKGDYERPVVKTLARMSKSLFFYQIIMKKEVKTSIDGLQVGMFVSRLDRPWIKTPFELEGIRIASKGDIDRVRKYCNYVYIDVEQGIAPEPRYWILAKDAESQIFQKTPKAANLGRREDQIKEYQKLRKISYKNTEAFEAEVKTAEVVTQQLSTGYEQLLEDLENGRDLDLEVVKSGVTDMVKSIVRNPSAMLWIVQIKGVDQYTYSRALGTSVWCATFGRHLGLDKKSINDLALGGLLLDLGKSRLPLELIKKPDSLTEDELRLMQEHVDLGIKLLLGEEKKRSKKRLSVEVLQMVATHHERADGSGYPQGLTNQDIPIYGRIAGIVDSYDAMTSKRPYVKNGPHAPHEAISELYKFRDTKFQAELIEQFIQTVGLYPTGSLVELNTGQVGAVVEINGLRRLQPTVLVLLDENKEPYPEFKYLDLSKVDDAVHVVQGLPPGAYGIDMQELFLA